ncbi:MAG: TadE family protein [Microthrixaceae bacterium]
MTETTEPRQPDPGRGRGDGGTALVEFALVMVLLFTLIFGIINLGLILSFKQDLTRAAAEGARAAAVAYPASSAVANASTATEQAVQSFKKTCVPGGGLTCAISLHDCGDAVPDVNLEPAKPDCVQVDLTYDYESHPLLVPVPIIAPFLPDQIKATSDSRINT